LSDDEDRVAINYKVPKPSYKDSQHWPRISYFGVFDGHGGSLCAEFLRDNLLEYVLRQSSFPSSPVQAIKEGFAEAEEAFLKCIESSGRNFDRSGGCANIVIIIKDICYVANVGNSRAVLSCERGLRLHELSQDHKPNLLSEQQRIEQNGGKIYSPETPFPACASDITKPFYRAQEALPSAVLLAMLMQNLRAWGDCVG
jgi:protein phosphatase 2C family protein 2/3